MGGFWEERFVNTRKRFLTPIITEIQRTYGTRKFDAIQTKRDLYELLREMMKDPGGHAYNVQWIASFLSDSNCGWFDNE